MKYAISTIIFQNPSYIVGACISFHAHKQFIKKLGLKIKLIVLVDELIYGYKNILEKYFDSIIRIKLETIKLNYDKIKEKDSGSLKKYSKWIKYSINKWQIINQEEYDKILFIDVDVLPVTEDFYDIFKNNTPSVLINKIYENNILIKKNVISNKDKFDLEDYNTDKYLNLSINASMLLINPNENLYDEYLEFVKICEGKNGYESSHADETSLLYFLMFYKNINLYSISKDYCSLLKEYNEKNTKSVDYPYMIKSWERLPMLQWPEENIWHILAKNVMKESSDLTTIYIKYLLERLIDFKNNWKIIKKNYNKECVENNKIYPYSIKLFKFIKNKKINELNESEIKIIFKMAQNIHGMMNKKNILNLNKLLEINN